jgi:hypothetical protein
LPSDSSDTADAFTNRYQEKAVLSLFVSRSLPSNGTIRRSMFIIQNGLKQGDVLSPLLVNFALEYAIRMVQEN